MSRAPFQVLVFPYMIDSNGEILYCVFRRQIEDGGYWQAIAEGGGGTEAPLDAAIGEGFEEAGIAGFRASGLSDINAERIYLTCGSTNTRKSISTSGTNSRLSCRMGAWRSATTAASVRSNPL